MRSFCKPLIPLNAAKLLIISHAHKYFRLILYKKEDYAVSPHTLFNNASHAVLDVPWDIPTGKQALFSFNFQRSSSTSPPYATLMQKETFQALKGGLLHCKRCPFRL